MKIQQTQVQQDRTRHWQNSEKMVK
jgi:hypothetical protein